MKHEYKILRIEELAAYSERQPYTLQKHFQKLQKITAPTPTFDFYFATAAVYSSQIEGNPIDAASYWKYREFNINTKTKSYSEIQDLITAYQFAEKNSISWQKVMKAHKLLSRTFLKENKPYQGKIRDRAVGIYTPQRELIYTAADAEIVAEELKKLFQDINFLLKKELDITTCFYFAAQIHLRFSQIHPFADGNGRMARLLEKWFLAQKLGKEAWKIASERFYQQNIKKYYLNIHLGNTYTTLDYAHALPFLLMLCEALRYSHKKI